MQATRFALLRATHQRDNRQHMIAGDLGVSRSKNFFCQKPIIVFQGILPIPCGETDVEARFCREQNRLYFPRAMIAGSLVIAASKEYKLEFFSILKRLRQGCNKYFYLQLVH